MSHVLLCASAKPETKVTDVMRWIDVTAGAAPEDNAVLATATLMSAVAARTRDLSIAIAVSR